MNFVGKGETLTVNVTSAKLNGGKYYCAVLNDAGFEVDSTSLFVTPKITKQPVDNIAPKVGEPLSAFTCLAESHPDPPTYRWEKFENGNFEYLSNADSNVLNFNSISHDNNGIYRCVASISVNGTVNETFSDTVTLTGKVNNLY